METKKSKTITRIWHRKTKKEKADEYHLKNDISIVLKFFRLVFSLKLPYPQKPLSLKS